MYKYGLIGNCQISALVSETGNIDWLCLPRPDSEPVFGRLLDTAGGYFAIQLAHMENAKCRQNYVENTNILVTEIEGTDGSAIRITDFCPRFMQYGRMFRPHSIFRIVEPIAGSPTIAVSCQPVNGWDKVPVRGTRGNSHVRFDMRDEALRVTTNMPLTYFAESTPFLLKEKTYFGLTWGSAIEEDLVQLSERFLAQTREYWRTWVKHCSVPTLFQKEVIRSALALKLHVYEDTGAILAALTTSLPEEVGHERNWDYRFCWLRDSYFVLSAFHNLGQFEEMEGFLKFVLNLAYKREESRTRLAPVYTLNQDLPLPETVHANWAGWKDSGPVRSLNQAAEHVQNDVYGEMVLTLSPIFFDERFAQLRTSEHEELMAHLGQLCARTISVPDAGLWEVRNGWQEHTFSNLMCWAGLERIERIQKNGYLKNLPFDVRKERERAEAAVKNAIKEGIVYNGPTDQTLDSALALLAVLRFPDPAANEATLGKIREVLATDGGEGSYLYRYLRNDDFGKPGSAFVICSFWIAQGLAHLGRKEEARRILDDLTKASNQVGLLAEHFEPKSRTQLGNFPQAYSHVGMINAAFDASPPWSEIL
ncbi:MAG: glycoside hydrolase family 15 protein [Bdellovibrionales bacterium]|nr:glycoside hydrolase family 15 protein [Bdellovibrionales bacterium]